MKKITNLFLMITQTIKKLNRYLLFLKIDDIHNNYFI